MWHSTVELIMMQYGEKSLKDMERGLHVSQTTNIKTSSFDATIIILNPSQNF
jgi:hypothetical protein